MPKIAMIGAGSLVFCKTLVMDINGETVTVNQDVVANDADGFIVGTMNAAFGAATAGTAGFGLVASMNSDIKTSVPSGLAWLVIMKAPPEEMFKVLRSWVEASVNDKIARIGIL